MKKFISISIILVTCLTINAQVLEDGHIAPPEDDFRTLFEGDELKFGAFGGPIMSFTSIDGEFAHMMGGGGAFIVGGFFFGGYGQGLTNKVPAREDIYDSGDYLSFGHGGFLTGFTLLGNKAIHPSFNMMIGFGNINLNRQSGNSESSDGLLVFEPGLQIEMNLTKFLRLGMGAAYRMISSVDLDGYDNEDFSGISGQLALKIGWF